MRRTPLFLSRIAIILFILGSATLCSAATVTMQPNKVWGPTNGLVGMWTFNGPDVNWTTNTALDRSGQGNNGLLVNMATKTSPTAGKLGQALKFNGIDGRIDAGSGSSLDDINQITVSLWVYPTRSGGGVLVKKGGEVSTSPWTLSLSLSNVLRWEKSNGRWSANVIPQNRWTHVLVTYDRTSNLNDPMMYINGQSVAVTENIAPGTTTASEAIGGLYVGDTYNNFQPIGAALDDVRIYNRILTPTEITQLYRAGQVVIGAAPAVKSGSGLVGWWTFNGPDINWTTNTALDRSGQGNNGLLVNIATKTSPTAGKLGQGLLFVNGADQMVSVSPASGINDLNQKTVSAWVKPKSSGQNAYGDIVTKYGTGGWMLRVEESLGTLYANYWQKFSGTSGQWESVPLTLSKNIWTHIAVTYDNSQTANKPTFYVNGIPQLGIPISSPTGSVSSDVATNLEIGNLPGATNDFDGGIDDVRIYNRILSAQEIKQLAGNGIVTINKCGTYTVKDADGNVYNTVQIGKQCWMKQNMRVGTRINTSGDQTNNAIIEKYCYSNALGNCTVNHPNQPDGGFYTWDEAMQYSTTPGARGICPSGWHIPTHDEFTTLERAVCTSGTCATDFPYDTSTTGPTGTTEGTKLKANGTSGFEANYAGYYQAHGTYNRNTTVDLWTSSESGGSAWYRNMVNIDARVVRDVSNKANGYSVRCLKN